MQIEGRVAIVQFPDGYVDYMVFNDWYCELFFSHSDGCDQYSFNSEARHFDAWCKDNGLKGHVKEFNAFVGL